MHSIFSCIADETPHDITLKSRREGETIVVLTHDGDIEFLNETAAYFFEQVDGKKKISDIYTQMLQIYNVEASCLQNDIVNLIRDLQWKRILQTETF